MSASRVYDKVDAERAAVRVNDARASLDHYYDKVYNLQKFTLGDYSQVGQGVGQVDADPRMKPSDTGRFADILVRNQDVGSSNKVLQLVRTLVQQTCYKFPDIDFPDAQAIVADVNSIYLRQVLGPKPLGCHAVSEMRLQLLDYCIGGMGWVWTTVVDGQPVVKYVRTFDVVWSKDEQFPWQSPFAGLYVTESLAVWARAFGMRPRELAAKAELEFTPENEADLDRNVTFLYYWDVEGRDGNHAVFPVSGSEVIPRPLFGMRSNPHAILDQTSGASQPFIPLECAALLSVPSSRFPIGITELVLPSQVAWSRDERLLNAYAAMMPFWDVEEGSLAKTELDKLKAQRPGEVIFRNTGTNRMQAVEPPDPPKAVFEHLQHLDESLTAMSGANPYASGDRVEGIQYASEVAAIQSNSGLVAGAIAADAAGVWARVVQKTLANGQRFDFKPRTIRYADVELPFGVGKGRPIGDFLRPDLMPTVREDSMQFMSKQQQVAQAAALLQATMPLAGAFPDAVKLAYEQFLRANGIKDVSEWLQAPQAAAPPQAVPGQPGQGQQSPPGQVAPGPQQPLVDQSASSGASTVGTS